MQNKPAKSPACPLCRKAMVVEFKPFCSRACRDKDLLNWLGEGYAVPVPPEQTAQDESSDYGLDSDGESRL